MISRATFKVNEGTQVVALDDGAGFRAEVDAWQLAQAVQTADKHYAGMIQAGAHALPGHAGRFNVDAKAGLDDAVAWLAGRGLLTYVNADARCVDLSPEVLE